MRTIRLPWTRSVAFSMQCMRPMRGSFNAFGSSSIRPKLPVVYAKRGTLERFDLYSGQPTLRPARLPFLLSDQFLNAWDSHSNALLYASLLFSRHHGAISSFHSFHQRRIAYNVQSGFSPKEIWRWTCASIRLYAKRAPPAWDSNSRVCRGVGSSRILTASYALIAHRLQRLLRTVFGCAASVQSRAERGQHLGHVTHQIVIQLRVIHHDDSASLRLQRALHESHVHAGEPVAMLHDYRADGRVGQ